MRDDAPTTEGHEECTMFDGRDVNMHCPRCGEPVNGQGDHSSGSCRALAPPTTKDTSELQKVKDDLEQARVSEAYWKVEHRQVREERDMAQKWLRFIADTQHRLLEAFKLDLTDDEWNAFADALEIPRALSPNLTQGEEG